MFSTIFIYKRNNRGPSIESWGISASLVILDVARCYLWLFTLYINIKIGKNSC